MKELEGKGHTHSHDFCCSLLRWVLVALTGTKNTIRKPVSRTPTPAGAPKFTVGTPAVLKIQGTVQNLKVIPNLLDQNLRFQQQTGITHRGGLLSPRVQEF